MSVILIISFIILLLLGVPIAISLGVSSLLALIFASDIPLLVVAQRLFTSIDSFPLMAIPLFILVGSFMESGGISKRLINLANAFTGHYKGGLAIVAIVASLLFGSISGSSSATVAALGAILIPAMINKGYSREFAGSVQAISGELGVIIPPSITMILFGVATGTSIGDLFKAGILPGILIALSLIIMVYFISHKRGYVGDRKYTASERWIALKESWLALLMPIIILGGIYSGIFTPTEAASVAAVYSFIIGVFVYREIKFNEILNVLMKSAKTTAIIMIIIANAGIFSWILSREGIFDIVADFFISIAPNTFVFLIVINILLLIAGMFLEGSVAIIILAPILTPAAMAFGIDPVHFGIIMIVNLAIGMCTPPVGVNLFISCKIADISLIRITKGILPFLLLIIVDLLIISFIPQISLFIPGL